MKVRIFSALTMQDAMNQVKETLGRDAIILHTRKFRKGGIGGFFGREMIEVMAAVDNDLPLVTLSSGETAKPKSKSAKKTSGAPVRSLVRTAPKVKQPKVEPLVPPEIYEEKIVKKDEPLVPPEIYEQKTVKQEDHLVSPEIYAQRAVKREETEKEVIQEIVKEEAAAQLPERLSLEPLALTRLVTDAAKARSAVAPAEEPTEELPEKLPEVQEKNTRLVVQAPDEELKSEITGMRQMLEQLLTKTKTSPTNIWYDYLIKREIQPTFAEHVLKGFPYALTLLNKNPEATKKMLYDRLVGYIRSTDGIVLQEAYRGECRKIALIGPTGVGKTTTLAKLAARFTLEQNASVAFITSDTYRIAAVEQLKTYANILNIALDVVYSPEELKKCLHKHQDKQLVLIDTAGRSQYNEEQMEELRCMLEVDETIQSHLVLSSTTKHQDALDIIDRFSACSSEHVIFTKIDEARNIGNIFNVMYEFPELVISYITDGQSVPDDIHPAEPSHLTDMLLRD